MSCMNKINSDFYFEKICEHTFELLEQQLQAVRKTREKDRNNKKLMFLEDRLGSWCQILINAKDLNDVELAEMGVL